MNRREAFKIAGAAFVSSLIESASPSARAEASQQSDGDLFITMHGPAYLHFPKDGKHANLHFAAFPYETVCSQPVHLPRITCDPTTTCVTKGQEKITEWMAAGLSITPHMNEDFKPKDYDVVAQTTAANPHAFPVKVDDWTSLQWIPRLDAPVDPDAIANRTMATIAMQSGRLEAVEPVHELARTSLWIWTTQGKWDQLASNPGAQAAAPQAAMTDRIALRGRYTGGKAVLTLRPLLNPNVSFDLVFKPKSEGGAVRLHIAAEPPGGGHEGQTRPLELYCAYYAAAKPPVQLPERLQPFQSNSRFTVGGDMVKATTERLRLLGAKTIYPPKDPHPPGGQPTPNPECGSMRVIY